MDFTKYGLPEKKAWPKLKNEFKQHRLEFKQHRLERFHWTWVRYDLYKYKRCQIRIGTGEGLSKAWTDTYIEVHEEKLACIVWPSFRIVKGG